MSEGKTKSAAAEDTQQTTIQGLREDLEKAHKKIARLEAALEEAQKRDASDLTAAQEASLGGELQEVQSKIDNAVDLRIDSQQLEVLLNRRSELIKSLIA